MGITQKDAHGAYDAGLVSRCGDGLSWGKEIPVNRGKKTVETEVPLSWCERVIRNLSGSESHGSGCIKLGKDLGI